MTTWNNATFTEIVGKAEFMLDTKPLVDDLEIANEEEAEAFLEIYMLLDNVKDTKELLELHRKSEMKNEALHKDLMSYGISSVGLARTREFNKVDLKRIELALEFTGNFARHS